MSLPFSSHIKEIADDMGISLFQKFSLIDASGFISCSKGELQNLVDHKKIDYIYISDSNIQFFGHQLVSYLLNSSTHNNQSTTNNIPEKIIRANEVQDMTGLSRTTIWRKEKDKEDSFPKRVSLSQCSVGWKLSEVQEWIQNR